MAGKEKRSPGVSRSIICEEKEEGGMKSMRITLFTTICLTILIMSPAIMIAQPIPQNVLKCVAYIVKPGNQNIEPIGTAFFIGYKYADTSNKHYVFLVTARHVLFEKDGKLHSRLQLRMNDKKTGRVKDYNILKPNLWFFHQNQDAIDIAIQPLLPNDADFLFISSNDFATSKLLDAKKIGIGDDVFYAGLLTYQSGREKIAPVVRFGKLALLIDEPTIDGKYYHFLDAGNIPGHSGSPVFLWATPTRETSGSFVIGSRIFGLYGVVSGIVEYSRELKAIIPKETKSGAIPLDARSGGLTGVVPVKYLIEILESTGVRAAIGVKATQ